MRGGEKKVLVLGVGNVLLSDEGLGVKALEFLKRDYAIPRSVSLVDGGTGGLALLSVITGHDSLIIMDAVRSGSAPGTVVRLEGADRVRSGGYRVSSLHELGMEELLQASALEGCNPEIVIIGMEPEDTSAGLELSPRVRRGLPLMARMVAEELRRLGVKVKRRCIEDEDNGQEKG